MGKSSNAFQSRALIRHGFPSPSEGSDGSHGYFFIPNKGVYHGIKFQGKWYFRLYHASADTLEDEINRTVTTISISGAIDHDDLSNVTADQHHSESHTIASHSDTTATGAELDELTDGSLTVLHDHDHDGLTNFVGNEHIDHTSVTLTAGAGLTGSGDISASRTFAVGDVDKGVQVNADDLEIDASEIAGDGLVQDGTNSYVLNIYLATNPGLEISSKKLTAKVHTAAATKLTLDANGIGIDQSITPTWTGAHTWTQSCTFQQNLTVDGYFYLNSPYDTTLNYSAMIQRNSDGKHLMSGYADYTENYSWTSVYLLQSDITHYDNNFGTW